MRFPKSTVLQCLISMFAGGAVFPLMITAFRREGTLRDTANNFITDLISPYLVGSFSSRFPLVWFGSVVCGAAYVICVTNLRQGTAKVAKLSLFAILSMSLFTLWLEPYTSLKGAIVQSLIEQLARLASKILDLGITVLWVLAYFRATAAISRECGGKEPSGGQPVLGSEGSHGHLVQPTDANMARSFADPTLVISRKLQFTGSVGKASIIVDGVNKGSLWSGGSMTLQLPTGIHLVAVKIWWVKTHISVTLVPGQRHFLQVGWSSFGKRLVLKTLRVQHEKEVL